jgi:hypothetical protein
LYLVKKDKTIRLQVVTRLLVVKRCGLWRSVPKNILSIELQISTLAKEGKIFEGSLADGGGSGYKLSLGEFSKNGTLDYTATMANPYTYTQFLVTEEPFEDADPNAASVVAGAKLVSPFRQ